VDANGQPFSDLAFGLETSFEGDDADIGGLCAGAGRQEEVTGAGGSECDEVDEQGERCCWGLHVRAAGHKGFFLIVGLLGGISAGDIVGE
jgi:hypothetical protein